MEKRDDAHAEDAEAGESSQHPLHRCLEVGGGGG